MANVLANIFGASPVQPLERQIDIAYRCAKKLRPFFVAAASGDWDKAAAVRAEIESLEHKADDLKKEIRLHLPKSLFMPVPREDLLELRPDFAATVRGVMERWWESEYVDRLIDGWRKAGLEFPSGTGSDAPATTTQLYSMAPYFLSFSTTCATVDCFWPMAT